MRGYLHEWLEKRAPYLKPKTLSGYESLINQHLIPAFGPIALTDLAPGSVQALWDKLREENKMPTANAARRLLRKALQDAYRLRKVHQNVVDWTEAPLLRTSRRVDPFTLNQIALLLQASPPRWRPVLQFTAYSGLRRGEVCGLKWSDWDSQSGILTIQRSIVVVHSKPVVQMSTKTDAGHRSIMLPTRAREALEAQRQWWEEQRDTSKSWREEDWVFSTRDGGYLNPRNLTRAYEDARDAASLPKKSFHDLRHFAVSLFLGSGAPMETVSKTIGHRSVQTTSTIYAHLLPEASAEAARKVDAWLEAYSSNI